MANSLIIKKRIFDESLHLAGTHPVLERIYAARNITSENEINTQLEHLESFNLLMHIELATEILFKNISQQKNIVIVGDFDADGATSSALAVEALKKMGAKKVSYLVPNRFEYGYGLTPEIVELACKKNAELIITVDNGISSVDGVKFAKQNNVSVIVTDHHLPGRELPNADAIVNPNQAGDLFPSKNLAGVGVIFYLMLSLRALMKKNKWFEKKKIESPNMAQYLDLVALGTVADVVPLDHNNRILVAQGLKRIRAGLARDGIKALLTISNRKIENTNASDLAFSVGPKLNAAGRLKDMSIGIECLLSASVSKATKIALQLHELNLERRQIETSMRKQADINLLDMEKANQSESDEYGVCLYNKDWHQGVIGILAARLKEKFHKPTIIFALAEENLIKGSARSIIGLHIRDILDAIASKNPGLISKFGGHAMAAGLSLANKDFEAFKTAYYEQLKVTMDKALLDPILLTDGMLDAKDLTLDFAEIIDQSGPWGQGFPEPLFEGDFQIIESKIVGEKHTKMSLKLAETDTTINAIAFNFVHADEEVIGKTAHMVYRLNVNEFNGWRSAQLVVDHIQDY